MLMMLHVRCTIAVAIASVQCCWLLLVMLLLSLGAFVEERVHITCASEFRLVFAPQPLIHSVLLFGFAQENRKAYDVPFISVSERTRRRERDTEAIATTQSVLDRSTPM